MTDLANTAVKNETSSERYKRKQKEYQNKKQELLGEFKSFWEEKDRQNPTSQILNLCFKPMEPLDFCLFWIPRIWPHIPLPTNIDERFPNNFTFACEVLLGWVLDRYSPRTSDWLRAPYQCQPLPKKYLRFVHIVWVIHFYTTFGFPANVTPKLEKAFIPPSLLKP